MTSTSALHSTAVRLAFALLVAFGIEAPADVLIANGRLFSATDGGVVERANVLVEKDRIVAVSSDPIDTPGIQVIDATGQTILPGLIDTHFHLFFDRRTDLTWFPSSDAEATDYIAGFLQQELEDYLAQGFTSIASPLDFWPNIVEVRERLASGDLRGPRLLIAGPIFTMPGEHGICAAKEWCEERLSTAVSDPRQAREQARRYLGEDVDFIVFDGLHGRALPLRQGIVMALSDEAHRHGRPLLLHGVDAAEVGSFIEWGVDALFTPPRVTRDRDGTLLPREIVEGLPVSITLDELREPKIVRHNILTLIENGAVPVFGPDLGGTGAAPGEILMSVSQSLMDIGLGPEQVILAATRDAARLLGRNDLGTVAPGNMADLLVVYGDPLTDFDAIRNVALVIQDGRIVLRNEPP